MLHKATFYIKAPQLSRAVTLKQRTNTHVPGTVKPCDWKKWAQFFWVWKWFIPTAVLWWREAGEHWTVEASHWMLQLICLFLSVSICLSVSLSVSLSAAGSLWFAHRRYDSLYGDLNRSEPLLLLLLLPCPLHCPQEMQHSSLCRQQQ